MENIEVGDLKINSDEERITIHLTLTHKEEPIPEYAVLLFVGDAEQPIVPSLDPSSSTTILVFSFDIPNHLDEFHARFALQRKGKEKPDRTLIWLQFQME